MTENQYGKLDTERAEAAIREFLYAIGEDPDREGLQETSSRCACVYGDFRRTLFRPVKASHEAIP